jgi:hypothetical protein
MKTTTQTNHKNANPPPKGNSQTATNVANTVSLNGDGTVNFSNYVESHDFLDTLTQEEMLNTSPAPHQHTQESETESEDDVPYLDLNLKQGASDSRHSEDTPANPKTNDKQTGFPLKRLLVLPNRNNDVSVITPQAKNMAKASTTLVTEPTKTTTWLQGHNAFKLAASSHTNTTPTYFDSKQSPNKRNVKSYYSSPFLDKEFKPASDSFDLSLDLEILRPLIMSQHEVFVHPIKDLGNINLFLTKIIEKKKQSLTLLQTEQKIPRSLRIKCELTTSPSYASNQDFIRLKEEMQDTVANFIKKGTEIMTEWASVNIKLLTYDRCSNLLLQAVKILEGLSSFYLEDIGTPKWKSLPSNKYIPLFLFKLYFSNEYINIDDLLEYLDTPLKEILYIGTKQLTDATTTEEFELILDAINFADIDPDNPTHESFIIETLTSFDQIMKATTMDVWSQHKERVKHVTAAQNLKAKMKAKEISDVTAATSLAITKATENINAANAQNLTSILRINNLEKLAKKQEHKSNEILNALKTKRLQKNSNGSYKQGSVTSPTPQTPKPHFFNNQKIIDLSTEESVQPESHTVLQQNPQNPRNFDNPEPFTNHRSKRQKKERNQAAYKNKKVQWSSPEPTHTNQMHASSFPASYTLQPPTFQPAPAPALFHQQQYPIYSFHQLNPFGTNFTPQVQPHQNPHMVPHNLFGPQPQHQHFQQDAPNPFLSSNQRRITSSRENPFGTKAYQNLN